MKSNVTISVDSFKHAETIRRLSRDRLLSAFFDFCLDKPELIEEFLQSITQK